MNVKYWILVLTFFITPILLISKSSLIFYDEPTFVEFRKYENNPLIIDKRNYDVLRYDLFLDWYNVMHKPYSLDSIDKIWRGINTILFKSEIDGLDLVEFDVAGLRIDSIFVQYKGNWVEIFPTPKIFANKIKINLPFELKLGESASIKIHYTYNRNVSEENYRGFYLYPKGKFVGRLPAPFYDSVFVEERLAYTMSEPEDARYWMPCNDAPYDKAEATITVRVPSDYVVASNGYLYKIQDDGDTAKIFFWVSDKPITTYLMAVTASKYYKFSHWYKKITNPNDSIEIQYYVWEKDFKATKTDGSEYNATNTFKTTVGMMDFFSRIFIEYPFVKYGMVTLMPFNFGGMEHQTITSINRVWLRQNTQFGIAHELAHQWIGDLVTCATWKDIWFNEGGATWSEALYAEKLWGKDGYNLFLLSSRNSYLKKGGLQLPPIYDLPINTIFGDYSVLVYQKASWVYHMLKEMIGDSLFFDSFRSFLMDYSYKSITTEDFINYFKNKVPNPIVDFDTYFDQWLHKPGHPVFSVSSVVHSFTNDSGWYDAEIYVSQIQTGLNVPDVFKTPIKIFFKNADSIYTKVFLTDSKNQVFSVSLPFFPDSIVIDTTFILCEVGEIFLSVNSESGKNGIQVFPNPLNSNELNLSFTSSQNGFCEIVIIDALGNVVLKKIIGFIHSGLKTISLPEASNLSYGVYQILLKCGNNLLKSKFVKLSSNVPR